MARYTVEISGKSYDVDADSPQAAALAAHQVVSKPVVTPQAKAATDAQRRAASVPGAVRALTNGFGFNTSGTMDALTAAGETGVHNLVSHLTGQSDAGYGMSDAYGAVRSAEDAARAKFTKDHPIASVGSELAGAAINPLNRAAGKFVGAAKTLPQAIARGAITGGLIGGAYGAGGAPDDKRLAGTLAGGLSGTLIGGAVPPAAAILSKYSAPIVDAVTDFARPFAARALRGLSPALAGRIGQVPVRATPAELRVGSALDRALQRDAASGVTPRGPGIPFQTHGENVGTVAEVLAQSPGPAKQAIISAAQKESIAAPERIKSAIATGLGGRGDYFATMDAAQGARQAAGNDLMKTAFAQPIETAAFNEKIAPVLSRLPRGSLDHAYDIARKAGENPEELGLVMRSSPVGGLREVQVSNPTMKTLHYIKKGLDQSLEQYRNPVTRELDLSGSPGAQVDSQVRKALGRTMRDINPDYDKAMQVWGDESDQINALELGRNVFSPKFDMQAERLKGIVGDMSDASKANFRKGVGESVLAQVRSRKGGINTMRDLLKSEEFGDRVALAFPDDKSFADFMATAEREVGDANRRNTILSNSRTDARGAARADLNDQGVDPLDVIADTMTLNPAGLARSAAKAALKSLPRKDRSLIGNPQTNALMGKALTDQEEMTRLLNLLQASRARQLNFVRPASYVAPELSQLPENSR